MSTHRLTVFAPEKKSVYQFRESWNEIEIKQAVEEAGEKGIPFFELSKIEIQPVKICQLDCSWCFGRYLRMPDKQDSRLPGGDTYFPLDKMENNLFHPLYENGINPVVMLAGLYSDPLAYPYAADMMRLVGKYKKRFGLYTNGIGLKEDVSNAVIQNAGLRDEIPSYVSFDIGALLAVNRFEEIYPRIVKIVKDRNPNTLQVNAPIVLNEFVNWEEPIKLEKVHEMLLEANVDTIRYNFAIRPIKPEQQVMIDRVLKLEQASNGKAKLDTKSFNHCYVMTQSLAVHASGKVFPCSQTCTNAFEQLSFGNLNEESIIDIWQGGKHKAMFQKFDPSKSYCRCNVGDHKFNEFAAGKNSTL